MLKTSQYLLFYELQHYPKVANGSETHETIDEDSSTSIRARNINNTEPEEEDCNYVQFKKRRNDTAKNKMGSFVNQENDGDPCGTEHFADDLTDAHDLIPSFKPTESGDNELMENETNKKLKKRERDKSVQMVDSEFRAKFQKQSDTNLIETSKSNRGHEQKIAKPEIKSKNTVLLSNLKATAPQKKRQQHSVSTDTDTWTRDEITPLARLTNKSQRIVTKPTSNNLSSTSNDPAMINSFANMENEADLVFGETNFIQFELS